MAMRQAVRLRYMLLPYWWVGGNLGGGLEQKRGLVQFLEI